MTLEKGRLITRIFIVVVIIVTAIFDIAIDKSVGVDATISRVLLAASVHSPVILIAFGLLVGHLFWAQRPKK